MATKKPICLYAGVPKELQAGDDLPAAGGAGKLLKWAYVLSDVEASAAATIGAQTTPFTTAEGVEYTPLALAFTPTAGTSVLEVRLELMVGTSGPGAFAFVTVGLFDSSAGTGARDVLCAYIPASQFVERLALTTYLPAGSTAARTFTVRYGCNNPSLTLYINRTATYANLYGAAMRSLLAVKEYAP